MRLRNVVLISIFAAQIPVFAQAPFFHIVSIGVAGGVGLTDAFSDTRNMGVDNTVHYFSGSKDYIVGPSLEIHLPLRLSVEFDALYRPMNLTVMNSNIPASIFTVFQTVNSWEFPLPAKYRFPAHTVKPFVEAGPSFRRVSSFPGDSPHLSRAGFTAGGGVEFGLGPLTIDPEVRYTRWGSDLNRNLSSFDPQSNVNQAELLLGMRF